jgi:hypothetical protein
MGSLFSLNYEISLLSQTLLIDLPDDIQDKIISLLNIVDYISLLKTCKRIRRLSPDIDEHNKIMKKRWF